MDKLPSAAIRQVDIIGLRRAAENRLGMIINGRIDAVHMDPEELIILLDRIEEAEKKEAPGTFTFPAYGDRGDTISLIRLDAVGPVIIKEMGFSNGFEYMFSGGSKGHYQYRRDFKQDTETRVALIAAWEAWLASTRNR